MEMPIIFARKKLEKTRVSFSAWRNNLFGFDFYFILRGIKLPVWKHKELNNVSGSNLMNINFGNLSNQIKFINTLKQFQQSLANISATATADKNNHKKANRTVFSAA